MAVGKIQYIQHQLPVDLQIALLKSQGLSFIDEASAARTLNHVSMFRMRSYFRPLRVGRTRRFKPGATFEQAYGLYRFDSELRRIIAAELEKIEVSVRTQLSYIVTDMTGDPFWFTGQSNFRKTGFAKEVCDKLKKELNRSDDDEITDFLSRYSDPLPPSWVVMEVASFGTLSKLFQNLNSIRYRKRVAGYYGLSDSVMGSWLRTMVYIRNICAHHGKLWNRSLLIRCAIPQNPALPFLNGPASVSRIYYALSIILYFLQTVEPQNTFAFKIKSLIGKHQNVDLKEMGFPAGWGNEPLWQ